MHPTVKPVTMVADAMLDCSRRNDIVLDPFAGSGTTLVAAQRTRRRGFDIQIDPLYRDVIIRRMQTLFKLAATRTRDHLSLSEQRTFGHFGLGIQLVLRIALRLLYRSRFVLRKPPNA